MSEKLSDRLEAEAARTRAEWTRAPTLNPKMEPVHPEPMRLLLREAAAALRAVEWAAVGLVNTYGEDDELAVFGDAIDGMKIGQRVALVPLDAAGSAEGVGGG